MANNTKYQGGLGGYFIVVVFLELICWTLSSSHEHHAVATRKWPHEKYISTSYLTLP